MKSVIVPVDFSKTSSIAARFGANLAQLMGHNLHLVHVSDLVLSGEHSLTTPEQKQDEQALEKRLLKFTQKNTEPVFEANLGRIATVPAVTHSVRSGMAASQILQLSREETTAFIVMGGVGAGAGIHPPGLYGSVANPVAIRGGCPVILIPKGHGSVSINRLAIAFDDADEIIRIGKFSRSVIKTLRPEVRYVHVSKANWREEFETEDDFMDISLGKDFPAYVYKFDVIPEGEVAQQLQQYVKEQDIDLLIVGGKRQGFWKRLLGKNHLKPIIQACGIPVLVIPFSPNDN